MKSWLGLSEFTNSDILFASSGYPSMQIRLKLILNRRVKKLRGRWNSEWWPDFALTLVRRGLLDLKWPEDDIARSNFDPKWLLQLQFQTPLNQNILSAHSTASVVSQQLERLANYLCDGLKAVYGDLQLMFSNNDNA